MQCSKIDRKSPNCLTDDNFSLNTPIRCYNSGPLWTCQNTFTNEFFLCRLYVSTSLTLITLIPGWGQIPFFDNHITRRSLGFEKWEGNLCSQCQNKDNERHM